MKKYIILTAVVLAFLISSCKKCKCSKDSENEDPFLSYWFFDPGSIWVYQLNDSTVYDTVTILSQSITEETHLSKGEEYETKGRFYVSKLRHSYHEIYGYNSDGEEILSGGVKPNSDTWLMFQNYQAQESGYPVVYDNFLSFQYPYTVGDSLFNSTYISSVLTLETEAGSFEQTVLIHPHVYSYYNPTQTNFVKDLYLSPNVGVSKIVMSNNLTWELVSYDAIPYCRKKK